ncbi:SLBB domain-containing protein [Thermodesulfobacteriota bacterium]
MIKKHFIFFALFFLSIVITSFNSPLAQEYTKPATPETQKTIEEASENFKNLSDADKMKAFNQLTDEDKLQIFQRLEKEDKDVLLKNLTEGERKLLFPTLSKEDQEKWLRIYPHLEEKETIDQSPSIKPREREALSETEKILSGQFPSKVSRDLRQFGYDFFAGGARPFTPLADIPVGPGYIIGPGDSFMIHLWGRTEITHSVTVTRDGQINVPRLGLIMVSGLTFAELKQHLYRQFRQFYPDFKMSITMGVLRTIQVFIVGEAARPGTFSISSLSTVITALYAAGGPTKNGSLRNIRVLRNGNLIKEIDLYAFFVKGNKTGDIRLQPGDTIFIPVIGQVVGVAGNVRRPAIYELKGTQTIGQALELAGGVLPTGELQNVIVERVERHKRRVIKSFSVDPSDALSDKNLMMTLLDGDVLKIYPVHQMIRQVVYLEGHVKHPREHELKAGMKLRDLIPNYNALLPEPYLSQGEIMRLMPPDLHPEIIEFELGALLSGDEKQNLLLKDQDRVKIYGRWEKRDIPLVTIRGAVRQPGTYRLYKGMTAKDLIFQAGNLTDRAYLEKADLTKIIVVGSSTETIKLSFSPKKAMKGLPEDNPTLSKNDFVHIREIPQYQGALERKVVLEGEFVFPGEYAYSEGERLSSVVQRAGGLTKEAYPFGSHFLRESVKRIQKLQLDQYIAQLEEDILAMTTQAGDKSLDADEAKIYQSVLESKQKLIEKLQKAQPTGRMVVSLDEALLMPSSLNDVILQPGDRLVLGKRPATVTVVGEVYQPTALLAEENKTVEYYLNMVGGPNDNADKKHMYLVKANGSVMSRSQEGFFGLSSWDSKNQRWTMGGGFDSQKLDPGDTIIVPMKIQTYPWMRVAKDITQILANVALTAGVIIAAMN